MYLVQGELKEHVLRCWLSYSCIELLAGVFQDVDERSIAHIVEDDCKLKKWQKHHFHLHINMFLLDIGQTGKECDE